MSERSEHFDAVIVGAGQAGPSLANRLAQAGQRVAMVERKLVGGTCVNTGCTPTKTMVASAKVAHAVRQAGRFGVYVDAPVRVSLKEVKARADGVVLNSRQGLQQMLSSLPGGAFLEGQGQFVSPHEMRVGDRLLQADRFFLNVGGRPNIPASFQAAGVPLLTSSTILQLEELPAHLVIVGGGYIGLEFAQMFRRFGSEVTLVEMGEQLLRHEEPEASQAIPDLLRQEGITLRLKAECIHLGAMQGPGPQGVRVHVSCHEGEPIVEGTHALVAVGRIPNTADLGLEAAGVHVDEAGYITVNDELQTNQPHIWALGDCNRRGAFTHTSYNDYEIVAANLLDGGHRSVRDRIQAHALYTDPPLAQIGLTEHEARSAGKKLLTATRPMTKVSRAIEKGETFGFMKVVVDAETERILGATIFGVGGDEAIHCLLDIMYADAPYTTLMHAVHIHPTVAELIPTLLGSLKPAD